MWTRRELKDRAKIRFKATYWKTVLVSLIIMLLAGGVNIGTNITDRISSNTSSNMSSTTDMIDEGLIEDVPGDVIDDVNEATVFDITGIIVTVIIFLIVFLVILAIGFLIAAFIINPIVVGASRFFVSNLTQDAEVKETFSAFDRSYKNTVKIMFFRDLYTFLWSLLFIIPGIIKEYEYRMIPYLLAENPDMNIDTAFAVSKQMMMGNKWDAFVLDLSFILWHLLSLLTCGILEVFYVAPYVNMTDAALYATLKNNYQQGQTIVEDPVVENPVQEM